MLATRRCGYQLNIVPSASHHFCFKKLTSTLAQAPILIHGKASIVSSLQQVSQTYTIVFVGRGITIPKKGLGLLYFKKPFRRRESIYSRVYSQILYEPSGPWSRRLSPVSVVFSGWESLTHPGWDTNPSQVSFQQTLVLIYLPRKDGKLSY